MEGCIPAKLTTAWLRLTLSVFVLVAITPLLNGQSQEKLHAHQKADSRIHTSGIITNSTIISEKPIWIELTVTNVTDSDLYVPKHFNSNNYIFELIGDGVSVSDSHGDSHGATFEDFVRLEPEGTVKITHCFLMSDESGPGIFSVYFHNNLLPSVERRLSATGVPFVVGVHHSFGKITVRPAKPDAATNRRPAEQSSGSGGTKTNSMLSKP